MISWRQVFSRNGAPWEEDGLSLGKGFEAPRDVAGLKAFLDAVHIRLCLVCPFQSLGSYPLVETRELLPSFDNAMTEHGELPGFSLCALARPLSPFRERFQHDMLYPPGTAAQGGMEEREAQGANAQSFLARLPRARQEGFRKQFARAELTSLALYPALLSSVLAMDRGHVLSLAPGGGFALTGLFASFPNDVDTVLKRFGLRIGKFEDEASYARNRRFVYQFLMEGLGFPIVSERRTSAALLARRLNNSGEDFLVRVLGQSDRVITTYTRSERAHEPPKVEKTALVAVEPDQREALQAIGESGFFLDEERRVVLLRVRYRQHRYDPANIRQDRALSVAAQEVLHPLTGEALPGLNIIRDATNMYLRLNDIVRGEYSGHEIYVGGELIDSTDTDERRLKVLLHWLSKNQRRMVDYSDEFFAKILKVLDSYLFAPANDEAFSSLRELHVRVCAALGFIRQTRRLRTLEELRRRSFHGRRLGWPETMRRSVEAVRELRYELVNFFPEIVDCAIACLDALLSDATLARRYLRDRKRPLTEGVLEVRRCYRELVSAADDFRKALRSRTRRSEGEAEKAPQKLSRASSAKEPVKTRKAPADAPGAVQEGERP